MQAPDAAQRPASNASRASNTSKRSTYRVVSKNSNVDETLFASSKPKASGKSQVEVINATAFLGSNEPVETDTVTLGASEVQRMRVYTTLFMYVVLECFVSHAAAVIFSRWHVFFFVTGVQAYSGKSLCSKELVLAP